MKLSKEDKYFNQYLKKYEGTYKLIRQGDGIWEIQCKNGTICPYNFPLAVGGYTNTLLFHCNANLKKKQPIRTVKKLQEHDTTAQLNQIGDSGEFTLFFKENCLKDIENILELKKVRKLSEKHKKTLLEASKSYQFR